MKVRAENPVVPKAIVIVAISPVGISLSRCLSACHDTMTVITTMNFKNAPNNEFLAEKGGEGRKRRRRRRRRKKGGIITG